MKRSVENIADLCESQEDYCKKFIDKIIKTNREIFILSSLLEKQMCGYDIIKEIFSTCDVFLSQGTVYPILYTLEEDGIINAEYSKGDMRSKKYSLTPKGREVALRDIEEFIKALEQISVLIKR
ncbi:Transcriptional regulator PadR-like family protein [uncultured archaeon]|nr:Transcriptional regulator PadR-like family protein [uncultured archaeon]